MNRKRLSDVFSLTDGIFSRLKSMTGIPWGNDTTLAGQLDLVYLGNHSGEKYVAPLLNKSDDDLTSEYKTSVLSAAYAIYKNKWTKLYAVQSAEYNPIENYSMIETHSGSDTKTDTPTNWKDTETKTPKNWKETKEHKTGLEGYSETETQTPEEWKRTTESLTADNKSTTETSVYAFGSSTPSPNARTETELKNKSTDEQSGTFETKKEIEGSLIDETSQTGTFTTETEKSGTYESETVYDTTLERSGNIGTVTAQDMITQEIELWQWLFFETVFKDLDQILTLSTY